MNRGDRSGDEEDVLRCTARSRRACQLAPAFAAGLLTPAQQRRQQAAEHNLLQMAAIEDVLIRLRRHVPMQLDPADDLPGAPWCLSLQGLKNLWEPEVLKARFEVVASSLWELQTGKGRSAGKTLPLVQLIRYAPSQPGTLELVLTQGALIQRLPGGLQLLGIWRALLTRLLVPPIDDETGPQRKPRGADLRNGTEQPGS